MKLIYKGNYKGDKDLPIANLPSNAVKFKEPETPESLAKEASFFLIPIVVIIGVIMIISITINGEFSYKFSYLGFVIAMLFSLLTILPHEILHGICFGKNAEVQLYISMKNMMAFVVSNQPISKKRFIFLSLLPNLIFGWMPLFIWAILPYNSIISNFLLPFSIMCITFGVGDYLNVYNAIKQMPKGSIQILSGFHSYWYIP